MISSTEERQESLGRISVIQALDHASGCFSGFRLRLALIFYLAACQESVTHESPVVVPFQA